MDCDREVRKVKATVNGGVKMVRINSDVAKATFEVVHKHGLLAQDIRAVYIAMFNVWELPAEIIADCVEDDREPIFDDIADCVFERLCDELDGLDVDPDTLDVILADATSTICCGVDIRVIARAVSESMQPQSFSGLGYL